MVKLEPDAERLLKKSRIGMLAVHGERLPLVNPAAFHYGSGSIWITTSRHAAKLALTRRDPRIAFMVDSGGWGLLLQGTVEVYDPVSVSGPIRAALDAPRFLAGLAGYAIKNAAYVGGYLVDIAAVPRDWWPQNRVVLRLRPERARAMSSLAVPPATPATLAGVPGTVARALARVGPAYVCWYQSGWPALAPGLWTSAPTGLRAWLPPGSLVPPGGSVRAAVVVESHPSYRATRMQGACMRGRLTREPEAEDEVGQRYGVDLADGGRGLCLEPSRVTWWRGFEVDTTTLPAVAIRRSIEPEDASATGS